MIVSKPPKIAQLISQIKNHTPRLQQNLLSKTNPDTIDLSIQENISKEI